MIDATILIPTFDHGLTLRWAVTSALAQTVQDVEVLVVGDGVPEVTRKLMAQLMADDERIRFFDNAKGARHGELHRHAALQEARGRIVAYLSDDDLWFADHLEVMAQALQAADFAGAFLVKGHTDGTLSPRLSDLGRSWYLRQAAEAGRSMSLSAAAHTLDLYRRLPHGWRTTPDGVRTDAHMWQQILAAPGVRVVSVMRPTVLAFGSPARGDMSMDERAAELAGWWARLADPAAAQALRNELAELTARAAAAHAAMSEARGEELDRLRVRYRRLKRRARKARPPGS